MFLSFALSDAMVLFINIFLDIIYLKNNSIHVVKWEFNYKTSHEYLYVLDFACMQYAYSKKASPTKKAVYYGYYDVLANDPEVGLVLISEDMSTPISTELTKLRATKSKPLVFALPASGSEKKEVDYRKMLKRILGV